MIEINAEKKSLAEQTEEEFLREQLAEQGMELEPGQKVVKLKFKSQEEGVKFMAALEEKYKKFKEIHKK